MRMRTLAVMVLVGAGVAEAQVVEAPPTTQQAAVAPAREVVIPKKVLVLSFEAMGGVAGSYDWVGRGIQKNLVADLGKLKELKMSVPGESPEKPAGDLNAALAAGRLAGADYVVFGSFQLVDPDLRMNGEVVEVATGKTVGTLKSTGAVRDLFAMEDTITSQAKRALAPPAETAGVTGPAQLPLPVPVSGVQPQPQVASVQQQPPVNNYITDYNRYTYQPTYPYGYGYGYGGYYPDYGYSYYPGVYGYGWASPWIGGVGVGSGSGGGKIAVHQPIGIGTSGSLVARPMISVPGYRR